MTQVHSDRVTAAVAMAKTIKQARAALVEAILRGGSELRPAHTQVFEHLDPEGTRLTSLADRVGMSHQAMGELVGELVTQGYLERVPDPADGRARLLRATVRGERERARAVEALGEIRARWQAELGTRSVDEVLDGLAALIRACAPPPAKTPTNSQR
jgi:DNA-binding MarR family transcriptional regulator